MPGHDMLGLWRFDWTLMSSHDMKFRDVQRFDGPVLWAAQTILQLEFEPPAVFFRTWLKMIEHIWDHSWDNGGIKSRHQQFVSCLAHPFLSQYSPLIRPGTSNPPFCRCQLMFLYFTTENWGFLPRSSRSYLPVSWNVAGWLAEANRHYLNMTYEYQQQPWKFRSHGDIVNILQANITFNIHCHLITSL